MRPLTLGVEEEFLLLDAGTGQNAPVAEKLTAALPEPLRRRTRREFRRSMLELVTDVCTGLGELGEQLLTARRAASAAAVDLGARLVAVGATPVAEPVRTESDDPRFRAITAHYGPIARDPAVCGCHVHVGVPDPATAVAVCTRLRGWLPVIQALAANSPLFEGADTGFASWRGAQLLRWPGVRSWPHLTSVAAYRSLVGSLVAAGSMLDETMILWWSRPSSSFPTIEVRVADVCPRTEDTVLIAALVRALVATDLPAAELPSELVDAAHWNAARTGLTGTLLDARTGKARAAWSLVSELAELTTPALRAHGDLDVVLSGLDRLRREGTGADRQRRLLGWDSNLIPVLDHLSRETVAA